MPREASLPQRETCLASWVEHDVQQLYNSAELILACKVTHENKKQEEQKKLNKAKKREAALYAKTEDIYVIFFFCKKDHLLDQLNATEMQDIVQFLCCVEKKGTGDTFSNHSKSK